MLNTHWQCIILQDEYLSYAVCPLTYSKGSKTYIGMSSKKFCLFLLEEQCLQMYMVLYVYGRESEAKGSLLCLEQKVSKNPYFLRNLILQAWTNFEK